MQEFTSVTGKKKKDGQQIDFSLPATTPITPSSLDNFSTNCRGVRCRTHENSIWTSSGTRLPQYGAQEERTLLRSHLATMGALSRKVKIVT
jgi:hypothetical protein